MNLYNIKLNKGEIMSVGSNEMETRLLDNRDTSYATQPVVDRASLDENTFTKKE